MLTVACVKAGTKYGPEYVNTLFDMVRRNLPAGFPGRFVCLTDDPYGLNDGIQPILLKEGINGWWNKLQLFRNDVFEAGERILYFDLDTVITGPLDDIAKYDGEFAILRDAYRPDGLQSSVMAWKAGSVPFWKRWHIAGCPMDERGDQGFLEDCLRETPVRTKSGYDPLPVGIPYSILQEQFPGRLRSYKVDCRTTIPRGTSVVFFHGEPRPHQVTEGWVPNVWKIGGGSGLEFVVTANTPDEKLRENVRFAKGFAKRWIKKEEAHEGVAVIVGGGPSLSETLYVAKGLQISGAKIFACNNTADFLLDNDIQPHCQVILDARPENSYFIPKVRMPIYCASQCDPWTLQRAAAVVHSDLICWHAMQSAYSDLIAQEEIAIGGGSTVGLKTMALAYAFGYRTFHLLGFDSSYEDNRHHAYEQSLNDNEKIVEASVADRVFRCAPWMVTQAEEFKELAAALVGMGCQITVHGRGLIPTIAQHMQIPIITADVRANEILKRIAEFDNPTGVEVGVFAGELSARLLQNQNLKLFMVDSWTSIHPVAYKESGDFHASLDQEVQDRLVEITKERVAWAGRRAQIMRMDSLAAAARFPDGSLDFVFLDADHSLEAVRRDIEAWWPKVRCGGYLCGHDYDNPEFPEFGVNIAVDERFPKRVLGENFTWFVRKAN